MKRTLDSRWFVGLALVFLLVRGFALAQPLPSAEDPLEDLSVIDIINGREIRITSDGVRDLSTANLLVKERDFWFAWYAFHPDTRLTLPSED